MRPQEAGVNTVETERSKKEWRSEKTTAPQDQHVPTGELVPKFVKKYSALICGAVLIVVLIMVLLWRSPRLPVYAFHVSEYKTPLPPGPLVAEDIRFAEACFAPDNVDFFSDDIKAYTNDNFLARLGEQLKRATPGGPNGNVIVVYVSAHGAVNRQNQPCLLLGEALPYDCSTWLPLERVLQKIVQANEKRRRTAKTILILDANRIRHDWGFGILDNQFASELENLVDKFQDDDCFILNSTSDGQLGHDAPELQGSVFSHFVARGLYGEADGFGHGRKNNKVTLTELDAYLKRNVDFWVRKYRNNSQVPKTVGGKIEDDEDFNVVKVTNHEFPFTDAPASKYLEDARKRQKNLVSLWQDFAELESERSFRHAPKLWAKLQREVRRANQLILAGTAYAAQFEYARSSATSTVKKIRAANLWRDLPPSANLTLQSRSAGIPGPESSAYKDLEIAWAKYLGAPEDNTAKDKLKESIDGSILPLIAWRALIGEGTGPRRPKDKGADTRSERVIFQEQLEMAYEAWTSIAKQRDLTTPPPELHLTRMIRELPDWETPATKSLIDQSENVLSNFQKLTRLSSHSDPRVQYWVARDLKAISADWRRAFDHLLVTDIESLGATQASLNRCADLLNQAQFTADLVGEAYAQRDQAWAKLPYLWEWALGKAKFDKQLADDLMKLIRSTQAMNDVLIDIKLASSGNKSPLGELVEEHHTLLESVEGKFADWAENLRNSTEAMGPIQFRLVIPLSVNESARSANSGRTNDATENFWALSNLLIDGIEKGSGRYYVYTEEDTQDLTTVNRQTERQWFRKQGRHPALMLVDKRQRSERKEDDEELALQNKRSDWSKMGAHVRDRLFHHELDSGETPPCLTKELEATCVKAYVDLPRRNWSSARLELADAANDMRAAVGFVRDEKQSWLAVTDLRDLDRSAQFNWRAQHCLENAWGWHTERETDRYFARATRALLEKAESFVRIGISRRPRMKVERSLDIQNLYATCAAYVDAFTSWKPLELNPITIEEGEQKVVLSLVSPAQTSIPGGRQAIFWVRPRGQQELLRVEGDGGKKFRRRAVDIHVSNNLETLLTGNRSELVNTWTCALYRGHQYEAQQSVIGGVLETIPEPIKPEVMITRGEDSPTYRLMFVLDCSGSMKDETDGKKRIEEAQKVILSLLPTLDSEYVHVGLTAFGHRFHINEKGKILRSDLAPVWMPAMHPLEDAEVVITPAPYSQNQDEWTAFFSQVKAHGATPLYYAITHKALPIFKQGYDGQIVVLTDGDQTDFQDIDFYAPEFLKKKLSPEARSLASRQEGKRKVIELIRKHADVAFTEIDIVDLARIEQNQFMKEIASSANGQFEIVSAKNGLEIILKRLLGIPDFYMKRGNTPKDQKTLRFETKVTLDEDLSNGPIGPFEIGPIAEGGDRLKLGRIFLEGGERILIDATKSKAGELPNKLEYKDFERYVQGRNRAEIRQNLIRGSLGTQVYDVYPLSVQSEQKGFHTFRLAIQRKDKTRFTAKPPIVWAEIEAMKNGKVIAPKYYAYNRTFQESSIVPIMHFKVSDWPDGANQAQYEVWFEPPSDAKNALPTDSRLDSKRLALASATLDPLLPGVTFSKSVEKTELTVFETHEQDSAHFPLHLRLEGAKPQSNFRSVSGTSGGKRIIHRFSFPSGTNMERLLKTAALRIITQQEIKKKAVKVGPIRLNLADKL